jgi:hypothetical protein
MMCKHVVPCTNQSLFQNSMYVHTSLFPTNCTIGSTAPTSFGCKPPPSSGICKCWRHVLADVCRRNSETNYTIGWEYTCVCKTVEQKMYNIKFYVHNLTWNAVTWIYLLVFHCSSPTISTAKTEYKMHVCILIICKCYEAFWRTLLCNKTQARQLRLPHRPKWMATVLATH